MIESPRHDFYTATQKCALPHHRRDPRHPAWISAHRFPCRASLLPIAVLHHRMAHGPPGDVRRHAACPVRRDDPLASSSVLCWLTGGPMRLPRPGRRTPCLERCCSTARTTPAFYADPSYHFHHPERGQHRHRTRLLAMVRDNPSTGDPLIWLATHQDRTVDIDATCRGHTSPDASPSPAPRVGVRQQRRFSQPVELTGRLKLSPPTHCSPPSSPAALRPLATRRYPLRTPRRPTDKTIGSRHPRHPDRPHRRTPR